MKYSSEVAKGLFMKRDARLNWRLAKCMDAESVACANPLQLECGSYGMAHQLLFMTSGLA